ncbi:hypothetical protein RJT34_14199 [Clitoria ternatea]|uniref:Uncharacterized protein n=1 Tax=Clitoria ternatea TaxID=43366 RepID=A0AAN9JS19_CLITE
MRYNKAKHSDLKLEENFGVWEGKENRKPTHHRTRFDPFIGATLILQHIIWHPTQLFVASLTSNLFTFSLYFRVSSHFNFHLMDTASYTHF